MKNETNPTTPEELAKRLELKRQKRARRVSASGFAKRVWKTPGDRTTGSLFISGGSRFGIFN